MNNRIIRNIWVRRISLLIVLIFTLSCILSSCKSEAVVSPELIQAFNENEGLWYQFKLKEAKAGLEDILKKDPNYAEASRKMAFMEYYYYQDYDKAFEYIQKALDKQPEDIQSNTISGEIYFAEGQYENALKSYKKALDKDSKNADIYYCLAQSYIKLNKSDEAVKTLKEANLIDPFDMRTSAPLHLQYVKDGEYDKAYDVWKKGNARCTAPFGYFKEWDELYKDTLENKTANYHAQLGNLYAKLLLYDEAALELEKALKDDPGNKDISSKLNETNLFIKFRDELKECFYAYYRRRIINGPAEELSLKNEVENIYKQMLVLFPDIKDNPLSFGSWDSYKLNNEIQKTFNVTIQCFPVMDGVECTAAVKRDYPHIKVVILTTFDDDEYIIDALSNGAEGYILKDLPSEKLISSIRDVYNGNSIMQPEIAAKVIAHITRNRGASQGSKVTAGANQVDELTDREKEILILVARGMNNNEIAKNLFLSVGTVKNHIRSIYEKIGVNERSKAIIFAMEHHYLD